MSSIDRRGVDTDIIYSESAADNQAVNDGWLIFAGLMIVLAGIWNLCEGVIALFRSSYFIGRAVYGDLWFWAIVWIAVAVLELAAGYAIMAGRTWARWFGIVVVGLSALAPTRDRSLSVLVVVHPCHRPADPLRAHRPLADRDAGGTGLIRGVRTRRTSRRPGGTHLEDCGWRARPKLLTKSEITVTR